MCFNPDFGTDRFDVITETVRNDVPVEETGVEYNGVGPSGDATDSFQEFISHIRKDPRYDAYDVHTL